MAESLTSAFQHRGRSVAYQRVGGGPPIVLLHHAGGHHRIWADQVPALQRDHEVFVLDMPGYGLSDQPADGYRLSDYTTMLAAFLDELRLTNVVLIGNCLGSATALNYTIRHPERVRGLVLLNPLTRNTVRRSRSGPLAWLDARLPLERAAQAISLPDPLIRRIVTNQLGPRGRSRGLHRTERLMAHWGDRGRLTGLHGLVQGFPAFSALDIFIPPESFPPICTIWGARNHVLSARAGARLNRTLRPRTAEFLPDCGHLPMVEDPERVNGIILEFLIRGDRPIPAHPA
ncbi:alpha/beta hydrolase [Nocardia sp. NPDC051030]|uniref:alpha/beta fold hydrolase n=1 Tax=Nocardia sp. NPDC051030 TaxID=3155162 RepID=UPI00342DC8BC